MLIIVTVMSGLALLAAGVSLGLLIREKKRSQERNAAMADYVDAAITAALKPIIQRVSDLENGLIPDHEEAKRAVESLNDFNRGISAIMGFDPYEAVRKENQQREGN